MINEEIRDKEVRVIDSDGTMLGIMATEQALDLATEKKLDLVNISPNARLSARYLTTANTATNFKREKKKQRRSRR